MFYNLKIIGAIIFFLLFFQFGFADETSSIHGHILKIPVKEEHIRIILKSPRNEAQYFLSTDKAGYFHITGLEGGSYFLRVEFSKTAIESRSFFVEPSKTLYLRFDTDSKGESLFLSDLDHNQCLIQTVLDRTQITELPSAHNIWSLIENQDLSATTNRIDIGGLWSGTPALFSARGSISWTQTAYLLNGFDVTDPYCSGKPLIYPDFYSLESIQLINAGHSPDLYSPGGYLNMETGSGTDVFHGSISAFAIHHTLQSHNISPSLEKEGLFESHSFNHSLDGNFQLSGPLIPGKVSFFTSISATHISRNIAEYEKDDLSEILSGMISIHYRFAMSDVTLLWSKQRVENPSYGAGRKIPFSSTQDRLDDFQVLQAFSILRFSQTHALKIGLSYSKGKAESLFQDGISSPHGFDIFQNIPFGAAASNDVSIRSKLVFLMEGNWQITGFLRACHHFKYGFHLERSHSSTEQEIFQNIHLHFFNDQPLEIGIFNTPVSHKEASFHWDVFLQDMITFQGLFSIYIGANLISTKGWLPDDQFQDNVPSSLIQEPVQWMNLSPRLGMIIPLTSSNNQAIKISYARYFHTLPLQYLSLGNPNALSSWVYKWNDSNRDGKFQQGESTNLLRKEGPLFTIFDADMKRPYTDEVTLSYNLVFGSRWFFSLAGFQLSLTRFVREVRKALL